LYSRGRGDFWRAKIICLGCPSLSRRKLHVWASKWRWVLAFFKDWMSWEGSGVMVTKGVVSWLFLQTGTEIRDRPSCSFLQKGFRGGRTLCEDKKKHREASTRKLEQRGARQINPCLQVRYSLPGTQNQSCAGGILAPDPLCDETFVTNESENLRLPNPERNKSSFLRRFQNFQNLFCVLIFDTKSETKNMLLCIQFQYAWCTDITCQYEIIREPIILIPMPALVRAERCCCNLGFQNASRVGGGWDRRIRRREAQIFWGRGGRAHCDVGIQVCKIIHQIFRRLMKKR